MKKMAAGETASTGGGGTGTTTVSEFRAKVAHMKNWKPASTPSNRDRLELYALQKQVVSSDCPQQNPTKSISPAEKAKLNSWRTKRGLSQSQAMNAYILEADRQILVYGIATSTTPTNTPAGEGQDDSTYRSNMSGSVMLTPRGLAAIPLLCAAASESRKAYLNRLNTTRSGWWSRQEPLCSDPGSIPALPEVIVLAVAALLEKASLYVQMDTGARHILDSLAIRPDVVQSLIWPMHNILLVIWITVIFLSTLVGSALVTLKTMFLGSKRTGVSLESIFSQEIRPCKNCADSLTEAHQAATVRMLGLALYPLGFVCDFSDSLAVRLPFSSGVQVFIASGTYIVFAVFCWWYWFLVLPSMCFVALTIAFNTGWCFGLIELAGI